MTGKTNNPVHFEGMHEDMYSFFWEIAFQNETVFFEKNRKRFMESVKKPLLQLAAVLGPVAAEIDPNFNLNPTSVVSRIRRDTRYTKDKSPYRDHMWLGFRPSKTYLSECFVIYAEFEREFFGYGMGMYAPEPSLMQPIRERIIARPAAFLELVSEPRFSSMFSVEGELYKKDRFPDYPENVRWWLNHKSLSFCYTSTDLARTLRPEISDEIEQAMLIMKPVYRFIRGLD